MTVIINGTTGITSVNGSAATPSVTGTDTDTGIVYGTNTVTIATGGTAGLVQDSSQNISIGGSVAGQKLNVKGIVAFEAISGSTNNWLNYTYTDNTLRWNYNGSGSDELILNSNGVLSLLNASTTANGVGIAFPSTQSASSDANTLDDYEEGTWTPTVTTDGGGQSVTYVLQRGTYTKIGRSVTVAWYVSWSAFTGGSNGVRVSNLPFASQSSGPGVYYTAPNAEHGASVSYPAGYTTLTYEISQTTTTLLPVLNGSGQGTVGLTKSYVGTGSGYFIGSCTYDAA